MEVNKPWKNNDINKYYIISLDKETNEWKFFKEIVGHTVFWKDEPSRYGMTKTKAIEVLNIVKNLENEKTIPTESKTPTDGEGGTETPTNPTENEGTTTPTDNTSGETSGDTTTEPSESNNGSPTNTDGETSTGENNNGETASEGNTEPNNGNETNTDPVTPVEEPTTPAEPQYKIITISSVTYNSTEVAIFDDVDYNKLKSTLTYINSTYPSTVVHVVTKSNTGKSIFYFYLEDELTWFLELRTNIDYSLVNNVTTLDDIKELL